jgi:hypothetical protein
VARKEVLRGLVVVQRQRGAAAEVGRRVHPRQPVRLRGLGRQRRGLPVLLLP